MSAVGKASPHCCPPRSEGVNWLDQQDQLGIDAEFGGIVERLHVDQGHHVRHCAIDMHTELPRRARLMQVGDQGGPPAGGQWPDAAAAETGLERIAAQYGVARYAGGMRQSADIIQPPTGRDRRNASLPLPQGEGRGEGGFSRPTSSSFPATCAHHPGAYCRSLYQ